MNAKIWLREIKVIISIKFKEIKCLMKNFEESDDKNTSIS
jgi:hypothetical protein